MRSMRKPLSHHLFKSSPLPLQAFVSSPIQATPGFQNAFFINAHIPASAQGPSPTSETTLPGPISPTLSQTRYFSYTSPDPRPNYQFNWEANDAFLSRSSEQARPVFRSKIYAPNSYSFTRARPFSTKKPDPYSKSLDSTEPGLSSSNAIPVFSTITSPLEASQPIDAGSSIRKPISLWPGMYHSPVTNALWEARSSIFEKVVDTPTDEPSRGELVMKTPVKSRTTIVYKFSSDYILREQYRNPWNGIRMGKLLEDLDALAGTIAFKHCCNDNGTTRPLILVTASVDKMVLKKPIQVDTDLNISGAVTWVGRSSLEIQLEVSQSTRETKNASDSIALMANFTFVARDSKTGKSAPINQLSPETDQEKLLWTEAEERNKLRKEKRPNRKKNFENGDADRLDALLAEGQIFCDLPALADRDSILIRDTCLQNSFICQPQQRNIHGRIFGGFLMRRAFELAFSTTYAFAGVAPHFLEVDHVDFLKPVDVGNFLRFKSCVLYTELENPDVPLINVEVVAHVTRPELRSTEVSNKFYFTFSVHPEAMRSGLKIRNVVPGTEEEARRVLERMDAESSQFGKP
ncbi:acyl-coenzyme A thioesterase 9, mitochondrial-like isoform X1 [Juglans microcarpa x Juglans regia]|uniref:acyl-coenzyme A thioesterase 9, mitochondrial-like isoform X1 n=1 Tax=Juglans microcarpa x Juglans regia TaxID=2249226 RepID=UPI001B7E32B0|nr:acyl-coenzyme A thioesterase 9, mitochondrial-like isoform X1 [Juglans microcarpa x Juglans regia]